MLKIPPDWGTFCALIVSFLVFWFIFKRLLFDPFLKLLVYEWPENGYTYGIGVDCSEGIGQDNAVIEVLREATPTREPGQVAEWVSPNVTAFQMWPFTMAVGVLYSTFKETANRRVQCLLAIEAWTNGSSMQCIARSFPSRTGEYHWNRYLYTAPRFCTALRSACDVPRPNGGKSV